MEKKVIQSIILDTSPILNNAPTLSTLLAKCETLYTTQTIIDEIRDASTRSRLENTFLPFLSIRNPKPDSVKFVTEFSRKTGDFPVLSNADIQILALAYELDCEFHGGDGRLRRAPGQKGPTRSSASKSGSGHRKQEEPLPKSSEMQNSSGADEERLGLQVDGSVKNIDPSNGSCARSDLADIENLRISEPSPKALIEVERSVPPTESTTIIDHEEPSADASDSESGSDGWITPSNLGKQQAKDQDASTAVISEDQAIQVATITGDFAMQVS